MHQRDSTTDWICRRIIELAGKSTEEKKKKKKGRKLIEPKRPVGHHQASHVDNESYRKG